jgi:hypothetical protein
MGFTALDFVIMSIATWRISAIITEEDGPFGVFKWLRYETTKRRTGRNVDDNDISLVTCIKCASVWVAVFVLLFYYFAPELIWIFAASGLALMLRSYTGVRHG